MSKFKKESESVMNEVMTDVQLPLQKGYLNCERNSCRDICRRVYQPEENKTPLTL